MLAALFMIMIFKRHSPLKRAKYSRLSTRNWLRMFSFRTRCLSLMLLAGVLISCQGGAQSPDIPVETFHAGIEKDNVQVLDVRTLQEYNSGHIAGSLLADWTKREQFNERVRSLDKTKPVYTYCLSGGRSRAAAEQLRKAGFKEVYNLEGGIVAWKRAARPVQNVTRGKQMTMQDYRALVPADQTVLVDFGAVWCPPCKKMEPVLKELVQSHGSAFKLVNVDGGVQEDLAKELGADAFPTFIIYKGGKEVWRKQGVVSKEELLKQLLQMVKG
jgi:rhodanese-related sulfurtransferase